LVRTTLRVGTIDLPEHYWQIMPIDELAVNTTIGPALVIRLSPVLALLWIEGHLPVLFPNK
jgi:hypothetical protein